MIDQALKKSNILIVDDEIANIDILEGLLVMQGYENIKTTTDPREVLPLFASFQPDLILLDLMMPHLSGFEVMDQLKKIISDRTFFPILVLTADISEQSKKQALSGGATDFLTKPLDLIEVGLRIKNLLYTKYLYQELEKENDILEEKVLARTRELEIAKEKAEESDRLKTNFLNNISHEIRTPLNGILGFGQIITESSLSDKEKQVYFNMLNESSDRLIQTVTNFIDMSLLDTGIHDVRRKKIVLSKQIGLVVANFEKICQSKGISLIVKGDSSPNLVIEIDPEILSKILFHLISNAVKFTEKGSIEITYTVKNNELFFSIKDTGIGIPDSFKAKIFDPFIQEDTASTRTFEGNGLGLSITKKFIELIGGKIWFESEREKESVFNVSIPNIIEVKETKNDMSEFDDNIVRTVLIVDDDTINLDYLSIILKHKSIEVIKAANGKEAIEICQTNKNINLVFMNQKLPVINGFDATKKIKSFRNELPIIMITAHPGIKERQLAMEAGCSDYLVKPLSKEKIYYELNELGIIKFE